MEAAVSAQRERLAGHIIEQLGRRRMAGSFVSTGAAARDLVLGMVPDGAVLIRCGSETVTDLGIWDALKARAGVTVLDPYAPGLSKEEAFETRRKGFTADIMIASSNAVTTDGRIVNLDGTGNRVAPMLFGPKKVILVVGMNKVTADLESAVARVRTFAAPANNQRLAKAVGLKNPCVRDGLCHRCMSETKICNMWTVIDGQAVKDRIHVVLVAEDLGY